MCSLLTYPPSLCVQSTVPLTETLLLSDRTPYLALAILLYMLKPTSGTPRPLVPHGPHSRLSIVLLLPLSIYSLFSVLQHARSDKRICGQSWWRSYCLVPSEQLLAYHQAALAVGAQLEVLAAPWLLLSAWRVGIILPLAYVSYLRWQYYVSARQRAVYAAWDQMLTQVTEHHSCPRSVRRAYAALQGALKKWTRLQPAAVPPARPAQGVRAGAGRRSD